MNIGIGGSDLGPVMAYEALKHYSQRDLVFRFVSNVDGTDFAEAVVDLEADETMFLVASKTFTTLETMTNANTARDWALKPVWVAMSRRLRNIFVAISTNDKAVAKFGIDTANMFGFLGLGRWAVLDGFGDRAVDDGGDRAGELPRDAGRVPCDGRALPDDAV